MVFQKQKAQLSLSAEDRAMLLSIKASGKAPYVKVVRAKILLAYSQNTAINRIAKTLKVSRNQIERCVNKALMGGVEFALSDLPRSGKPPQITADDKAWVVQHACTKPKELGYPHELWTIDLLARHIRTQAPSTGHVALSKAGKSVIHKILKEHELQPHKFSYYLEQKDPEFEEKMAQILCVYKEVEAMNQHEEIGADGQKSLTFSYDEKPGIQALATVNPDLAPVPGKYARISRDYEYKRQGTLSLLAGINLHDGHIVGIVRDRHRSFEFLEFLSLLDTTYPSNVRLRLILDNHSAHTSKETMSWLKKHPNRFEFVFTPKHGSWLNVIEVFFSKMTRTFLRGIRVASKDELKKRIDDYLCFVNENPVVFRWKYKMDELL
ncbi:MAG: IS630 family transposase [Anaerolineaceae bacterium]|nr:IS630 family transposase [Anaerolineaceae bacterium]